MSRAYDYYVEPCQLCISRYGEGNTNPSEKCGWCDSSEDTHYGYNYNSKGLRCELVKIPYAGYGYPYHKSPHPTRQYFLGDTHVIGFDGAKPKDDDELLDNKGGQSNKETNKESSNEGFYFIQFVIIPCAIFNSLRYNFNYSFSDSTSSYGQIFVSLTHLATIIINFISYALFGKEVDWLTNFYNFVLNNCNEDISCHARNNNLGDAGLYLTYLTLTTFILREKDPKTFKRRFFGLIFVFYLIPMLLHYI